MGRGADGGGWGGGVRGVNEGVKLRLRTALHTMKLSQSSFGEWYSQSTVRLRTLREFSALRALPVYTVFEEEKSND